MSAPTTAVGDTATVGAGVAGRSGGPSPTPRRRFRARIAERRAGLIFMTPWLLGMALLTLGPMVYSLYLAFTEYDLLSSPEWVGLGNFREMLGDARFFTSVRVTLIYVAISVPVVLVVSMLVALLLNTGLRFIKAYRALFYLPSLLGASVAIATLWRQIFGPQGLINNALGLIGIQHDSWIGSPSTALGVIISLNAWAFGATMIIFLAGLRQVPSELYEAASVDGAGRLRRFVHITLPYISPLIFFNVLMDTVHAFQAFTAAYVVGGAGGGPSDSTLFYTLYLYQKGFAELNMGYASAMAWLLVAALALFTGALFLSARFWVHYGDR
jgi:multiple sugar transport system permease protein